MTVNFLFFSVRRVQQKMAGVVGSTLWILVVTMGLSVLLLPRMGLLGAGLAWFAAQASTAAVIVVRHASALPLRRLARAGPPLDHPAA